MTPIPPYVPPASGGGVSQAEMDAAIAALVDSAPGALDTLNEIAAAMGDDADFAVTINTAIGDLQDQIDALPSGGGGGAQLQYVYEDLSGVAAFQQDAIAVSGEQYVLTADPLGYLPIPIENTSLDKNLRVIARGYAPSMVLQGQASEAAAPVNVRRAFAMMAVEIGLASGANFEAREAVLGGPPGLGVVPAGTIVVPSASATVFWDLLPGQTINFAMISSLTAEWDEVQTLTLQPESAAAVIDVITMEIPA